MNILIKFKDFDTAFLLTKEEGIVFFEGRTWSGMFLNMKFNIGNTDLKTVMVTPFDETKKYSIEYRGYCDEVISV